MLRIKQLRESKGLNMRETARLLNMPYTTYVNYEKGLREPTSEVLVQLANFYESTVDYLVGRSSTNVDYTPAPELPSNVIPLPTMERTPLLGAIACGAPILAEEHIEDFVDKPAHIRADFALTCKGDSMINARIFDGDIVYIRQQDTVDSGEIAAVLVDSEATLKRVRLFDDHISLEPENPQYRPLVLWGDEMNTVRILGKAVAFTSTVR